jgi:hypothetical protein
VKLRELVEELSLVPMADDSENKQKRESRSEVDWNREASIPSDEWGLKDRSGKVIRRELTRRAADALQYRPDLVKKFGRLIVCRL